MAVIVWLASIGPEHVGKPLADVHTHSNGVSTDPVFECLDHDSSILGWSFLDGYSSKAGPLLVWVREARWHSSDETFGSSSGAATDDACHMNPDASAHRKI